MAKSEIGLFFRVAPPIASSILGQEGNVIVMAPVIDQNDLSQLYGSNQAFEIAASVLTEGKVLATEDASTQVWPIAQLNCVLIKKIINLSGG